MGTDVIEIPKEKTLEVFTTVNGLDPYLEAIKKEVASFVADVSTAKGRKEISSLAYKVSQSKTALDQAGKDLVTELKKKPKLVDAERKRAREFLDNLRDEVRKPLNEYEEEKERILAEHAAKHMAKKLLDEFNSDHEFALLMDEKITAEAEEAARIAEEERLKREDEIKKEAVEAARIEAEQKAKSEQERLEQEKAKAEEATKEAERQRIAAEERAKLELEQAEARRIEAERQAKEDAATAAENARQAEMARVVLLARQEEEATKKRESNKRHAKKINNQAVDCFVANGFSKDEAIKIVTLIAKKEVTNIVINY